MSEKCDESPGGNGGNEMPLLDAKYASVLLYDVRVYIGVDGSNVEEK